jgi:hypothetical protein
VTTVALAESAYVTLDSSGAGTVRLGPRAHGQTWHPRIASVATSTAIKSPTCKLYIGGRTLNSSILLDGTYTGEQNATDAITGSELRLGTYVWAVWSGGDAGAQATLTLTGTQEIG